MAKTKSTRVVMIVLPALIAILVLHMMLYRSTAQAYQSARNFYNDQRGQLEAQGSPKPWEQINAFHYETINHDLKFWEILRDARLEYSDPFVVTATTEAEAREHEINQIALFLDAIRELRRLSQAGGNTTLSFLDNPQSWGFLTGFPESVARSGTAPGDLLRGLNDTDSLMRNIPEGTPLYMQKEREYAIQLNQFGLNLQRRSQLEEVNGPLVAMMYTLNRVETVRTNVPSTELGRFSSDAEYVRRLYELFRLDFEAVTLFNAYKQLNALLECIELARKHNVADIIDVRLWEERDIVWPRREDQEASGEVAPQTDVMFDDMFGMFGGMEAMEAMDDPTMYAGMFGMFGGMEGMEAMGTAVVEEEKDIVGVSVPVEIWARGPNSAILAWLYELANNPRVYMIDMLDLSALPGQENRIQARVIVSAMSYYPAFGSVPTEEMTPTSEQIENNILRLLNRKKEIATRPGALQLAESEGFLAIMDSIPPYEGPEPAPLVPAAVEMGMEGVEEGML